MKAGFATGIPLSLLIFSSAAFSDSSSEILTTENQGAEAAEARKSGTPIMVLFSDEHCGYCERLKTEVLEPLVKRGELKNVAKILEFDIDRGGKIRDFDGEKIRTRIFVSRYDVYATPTLMLVDHQGRPLGTPIVGFNNRQDYAPYLADLIEKPSVSSQLGDLQAVRVSLQQAQGIPIWAIGVGVNASAAILQPRIPYQIDYLVVRQRPGTAKLWRRIN